VNNMASLGGPGGEDQALAMGSGSRRPKSKSQEAGFAGYAGDAPLTSSGEQVQSSAGRFDAANLKRSKHNKTKPGNHPWLDYPPNFTRGVAQQVAFFKKTFSPTVLFEPLPPEVKYTLTHNFGFFTSIFTQFFDKDGVKGVQQSVGLRDKD